MKTIIISPFAQNLRNGKENSKNFPYWIELVKLMKDAQFNVIQIGSNKCTKVTAKDCQTKSNR